MTTEHRSRHAPVPPNLTDYDATCRHFSWARARAALEGLPGGKGLNIAHEAVDRHAGEERVALRHVDAEGRTRDYSYANLSTLSARFANVLHGLGVAPGRTVCALLGPTPALYVAALGTWKRRNVFCALFSAFGPEPIRTRLMLADAEVLVTTTQLYRSKVASLRESLPGLVHVLIVDVSSGETLPEHTQDLDRLMQRASPAFTIEATAPSTPALLHFTSGTTGRPKGALHVHEAVVAHHATAAFALDLRADDVFWCTADPGWVTGISYGVIAPLVIGATVIVAAVPFDPQLWLHILQQQRVTVWYTAPTAVRMMMRLGGEEVRRYDCAHLRLLASVGEPLNPEAVTWGEQAFGLPIHDNWWQTETGAIMIANYRSMPIKPGSMGLPIPGIEAAVVRRLPDGGIEVLDKADETGELALRAGWPSMFRSYLGESERYRQCFADGWYLSGDLVRRDVDGYFWFVARSDDVIKSAGHLVGPFEVESALLTHPAVADVAVIGKPDPVIGEVVKAFVVLSPRYAASNALRRELLGHARRRLGAAVAPRELDFCDRIPATRSGKIMRRLLKARELGLPEGDLSTLLNEPGDDALQHAGKGYEP